jgi:hypothetical protein
VINFQAGHKVIPLLLTLYHYFYLTYKCYDTIIHLSYSYTSQIEYLMILQMIYINSFTVDAIYEFLEVILYK